MSCPARGAWVEIVSLLCFGAVVLRRAPQGARGLKYNNAKEDAHGTIVVPRKGRVG